MKTNYAKKAYNALSASAGRFDAHMFDTASVSSAASECENNACSVINCEKDTSFAVSFSLSVILSIICIIAASICSGVSILYSLLVIVGMIIVSLRIILNIILFKTPRALPHLISLAQPQE